MKLNKGAHIHLMGICGTAMASLAGLLKDKGFTISGSDTDAYPPMSTQLEQLGIEIKTDYKKENLEPKPDLVIVGNVIREIYEEAQALLKSDIPYMSLPQALSEFVIQDKQSIVISGTHGKTTSSSMMAWIAEKCGKDAGFLIGGIPKNFGVSFKNPKGDFFIIEGDEYDTAFFDKVPKFIHYKPRHVILTSVEFDHADIYKDLNAIKKAFSRLLNLIPKKNSTLIACADESNVMDLVTPLDLQNLYTYGIKNGDYQITATNKNVDLTKYKVFFRGAKLIEGETPIYGEHNLKNSLACIALSHKLGWDMEKVKEAFFTFKGIKRRQEVLGNPGGITIIEDFAHHPTAVKETIAAVQSRYNGKKVFSVFEPRSATSRSNIFQNDYINAFTNAHETILAPPFNQNSLDSKERFSSELVVNKLIKRGSKAHSFLEINSIISYLKENARSGDVILIMSNGNFGGIYNKLLSTLSNRQAVTELRNS